MQDEPNFGEPTGRADGRSCKTKPNLGRMGHLGSRISEADCAKQRQFPAVPGGTTPQDRGTQGKCVKRTQFGGPTA
jgi:hypothetical protein